MVNVLLVIQYFLLGGKTKAKFRGLEVEKDGFYVNYTNKRGENTHQG
jgi:hypothetical protein